MRYTEIRALPGIDLKGRTSIVCLGITTDGQKLPLGLWAETDHDRALAKLTALAAELEYTHLGAASSLREGMPETLTVTRLGVTGRLNPRQGRTL